MKSKVRRFLAPPLAAALLLTALSLGAAKAEEPAPEDETLRLAFLVVERSGLTRSFRGLTEAMRENMARVATTRPDIADDLNAALADMQADFDAQAGAMEAKAAALYAQKFSRRELADCVIFFSGPSGQAYVAAQPALMAELGPVMDDWRRAAAMTLMTRLHEKMRAKNKDF